MTTCVCYVTYVCLGAVKGRLICSCFPQKAGCVASGCNCAMLKVCPCICLSHLEQRFALKKTCRGGLFALMSMCLTKCGSSTESVPDKTAATWPTSFDVNLVCVRGRLRMPHMGTGRERQKEDLCLRRKD